MDNMTVEEENQIYKCAEQHVRENRKSYYVVIYEDTGIQNDA